MNTLEAWLERATRGLSAESKAKVRREIEEHYRAALEEPGATGPSALAALGDAKTANAQYRNELITSAEARMLREASWETALFCNSPKPVRFFLPLILFAIAMYFFNEEQMRLGAVFALCGFGVTLLILARWLPIYTPARGRLFRILRWAWMAGVFGIGFYGSPILWVMLPVLLWAPLHVEMTASSIRRKLPQERWPKSLYL